MTLAQRVLSLQLAKAILKRETWQIDEEKQYALDRLDQMIYEMVTATLTEK